MKKIPVILIMLLVLLFPQGCNKGNAQGIFGVYEFDEAVYLSPFSSLTKESLNRQMKGSKYTIREDLFRIDSRGYTVEYSSPEYVMESIPDDPDAFGSLFTFIPEGADCQYAIYDKNGTRTKWRLYVSPDSLWIGNIHDNARDGSEIVMYIYKLSKQ